jgi:hypothetical protein
MLAAKTRHLPRTRNPEEPQSQQDAHSPPDGRPAHRGILIGLINPDRSKFSTKRQTERAR